MRTSVKVLFYILVVIACAAHDPAKADTLSALNCADSQAGPGTLAGSISAPWRAQNVHSNWSVLHTTDDVTVEIIADDGDGRRYVDYVTRDPRTGVPTDLQGLLEAALRQADYLQASTGTPLMTSPTHLVDSPHPGATWECVGIPNGKYLLLGSVLSTYTWKSEQRSFCGKSVQSWYVDSIVASSKKKQWKIVVPSTDWTLVRATSTTTC